VLTFEARHGRLLASLLDGLVGPGNDFIVANSLATAESIQDGENVVSHQLPDDGQGQGLVAVQNVFTLDTNQGELEGLANFCLRVRVGESHCW